MLEKACTLGYATPNVTINNDFGNSNAAVQILMIEPCC